MDTPNGQTQAFVRQHCDDDPLRLALQAVRPEGVDMAYALTQIDGRQRMRRKVPSWAAVEGIVYPQHLSVEQCSSEATARYKASVVSAAGGHKSLADLTGGMGVDCYFMHSAFTETTYVERRQELADITGHNFKVLGADNIRVLCADGIDHLRSMEPVDWLFMDPARRSGSGAKTVALSDCEPDVVPLLPLLLQKAGHVMLKLSPMLDISMALRQMPHATEVHVVAVDNECKELLVVMDRDASLTAEDVTVHCVNLLHNGTSQTFTFSKTDEQDECQYAHTIAKYLYEPNAAVLKAGAYRTVARKYGLEKLHPSSHLYTSDNLVTDFPGRTFTVEDYGSMSRPDLRRLLDGTSKANLAIRNFPSSVAELRKRLHLGDGGDVYLFATTMADGRKVLVRCSKQ